MELGTDQSLAMPQIQSHQFAVAFRTIGNGIVLCSQCEKGLVLKFGFRSGATLLRCMPSLDLSALARTSAIVSNLALSIVGAPVALDLSLIEEGATFS